MNIPLPIKDLTAVQRGEKILVAFTIPELTTDGIIMRRIGAAELRVNSEAVVLADAKPGPYVAKLPVEKWQGQRVELTARVSSLKEKWSESNHVFLDAVPPVRPPTEFVADSHPRGVRLAWKPFEGEVRIWRKPPGREEFADAGVVAGAEWIDTAAELDSRYEYQVQALLAAGEGKAESERTETKGVTFEDRFPPSTPAGLTAVPGLNAIELSWERSPEPDTAGYFIYRATSEGMFEKLGELTAAPNFSDRAVQAGVKYRYAVSAVDRRKNESAKSAVTEQTLP